MPYVPKDAKKSARLVYRQTIDAVWSKSKFISKMTKKKKIKKRQTF